MPRGLAAQEHTAPGRVELAAVCLVVATPYVFHWLYGALAAEMAVLLVAIESLLLIMAIAVPRLNRSLPTLTALAPAMVFFGAVIAVGVWSLAPIDAAATRSIWRLVERAGSTTLDRSATLIELVKLGGLACTFLAAAAVGGSMRRLTLALRLLVYFGAAFALVAILLSSADAIYATQGRRVEARFLNPNIAGTVFGVITVLAVSRVMRRLRRGGARGALPGLMLYGACFAVSASALLLTLSRGAFAATVVGGGLLIVCEVSILRHRRRGPITPRLVALALIAGLALAFVTIWGFTDRLFPRFLNSRADMAVRALIIAVHWRAIMAAPWFGYGLGSFESVNTVLLTPQTFPLLWNIRAAQNVYLQWLEQEGFVGAISMFACIAAVMSRPMVAVFRTGRSTWPVRAFFAAELVILLHGAVDFSLEAYSVATFFALMLGLNFGAAGGARTP